MQRKTFEMDVKAADDDAGTFEALVSVFNNIDLVGDRVMKGAFKNTLARWRQSGDPIPIVLSHRWDDVMSHIGVADPKDVTETDDGLLVKGRLDLADNEVARQVYKLMKRRSLTGMSFGYTVNKDRVAEDGATELLDLDLVEAGPTLKGANPEAQLQAVKSALEAETKKVDDTSTEERSTETTDEEPPAKSADHELRQQVNRALFDIALNR